MIPGRDDVVLVDEHDQQVGTAGKLAAHRPPGTLHRAISVFLFDSERRLLLQRRAADKHHFRLRWSNSCCTHPRPGEDTVAAGVRRIGEELGVTAELADIGWFIYRAIDPDSGLVEHELDHVLVGILEDDPVPDPAEVAEVRWIAVGELESALRLEPDTYTPWLAAALELAIQ